MERDQPDILQQSCDKTFSQIFLLFLQSLSAYHIPWKVLLAAKSEKKNICLEACLLTFHVGTGTIEMCKYPREITAKFNNFWGANLGPMGH